MLQRRRKPKTPVGKLIFHWPKIRLGLKILRLARRARVAIRVALVGLAAYAVGAIVRRRRRAAEATPPRSMTTFSPPPTPTGGGTRETGFEAGPGTETERNLEAEKTA